MSEFPSLRNVVADAMFEAYRHDANGADAQDILTALRETCTIRTVEQLDALPFGSIVRATNGHAFEKSDEAWAFQDRAWGEAGNASPERGEDISLPALLLWSPEWETP